MYYYLPFIVLLCVCSLLLVAAARFGRETATDGWEVFDLELPLFASKSAWMKVLDRGIGASHRAIALRSRRNGTVLAWEFDSVALNNGEPWDVLFPRIEDGKAVWKSAGVVLPLINYDKGNGTLNTKGFPTPVTFEHAHLLACLTEGQAQNFVEWIQAYNRSALPNAAGLAPDYMPFDLVHSGTRKTLAVSQECNDLILHSLAHFQDIGVEVEPFLPVRKTRAKLFTTEAVTVVPDDDRELVCN